MFHPTGNQLPGLQTFLGKYVKNTLLRWQCIHGNDQRDCSSANDDKRLLAFDQVILNPMMRKTKTKSRI